jgi:hypothetical protein
MSIFAKPVAQITPNDLQELVSERAVENVRLEFKREIPAKDETLKKLSSFANTFGGDLVIGAVASSADGRIIDLPGVDPQPGYKQTVVQWCFAGATPPLNIEISDPIPVPAGSGKVCYLLRIAESESVPHFLNGRKGAYVRTDEFSGHFLPQLANENELRHLLERRRLIRERRAGLISRARERFETFSSRQLAPETPKREYLGARFEIAVLPRFPASPVCSHTELITLVRKAIIEWRQVAFPRNTHAAISQHESVIIPKPCGQGSFFEANIWGLAYYAAPIGEQDEAYTGIHTNEFIGLLLAFLHHARLLMDRLQYAGPLHVELLMRGIRNVPWIAFPRGFAETGPHSEFDDTVTFTIDTSADKLGDDCDRLASDLLQYVFLAINWPGVADNAEKLTALVDAGYQYNHWKTRQSTNA